MLAPFDQYAGGYDRIYLLMLLRIDPAGDIAKVFLAEKGYRVFYLQHTPEAGNFPQHWWLVANEGAFLVIDGASTQAQCRAIWDGYRGNALVNYFREDAYNPVFRAAAEACLDPIARAYNSQVGPYEAIGYSYGGAIAQNFAKTWTDQGNAPLLAITAFGAPKPAGAWLRLSLPRTRSMHWVNDNDPVPLVPPQLTTWQRVYADLTFQQAWNVNTFVDGSHMIRLNQDGTATANAGPITPPDGEVASVERWMIETERGTLTGHSFGVYVNRLFSLGSSRSTSPTVDAREPLGGGGDFDSPRAAERAISQLQSTIVHAAQSDYRPSPTIPSQRAYRAVRRKRIWYVELGGRIICSGTTRRTAQAIARSGNYHLRRLLSSHSVSVGEYESAFASTLEEMSTPGGGYVPLLNTDIFGA